MNISDRFGRLVVIGFFSRGKYKLAKCQCDCGWSSLDNIAACGASALRHPSLILYKFTTTKTANPLNSMIKLRGKHDILRR